MDDARKVRISEYIIKYKKTLVGMFFALVLLCVPHFLLAIALSSIVVNRMY
jgi:hypothetical protein